jgi:hypothetical protein
LFGEDPPNTARFPNAAGAALRRLDSSEKIMSGRPGRAPVVTESNPGYEPGFGPARSMIRRSCEGASEEVANRSAVIFQPAGFQDRGIVDEK